jgi:hypothetical protein
MKVDISFCGFSFPSAYSMNKRKVFQRTFNTLGNHCTVFKHTYREYDGIKVVSGNRLQIR